MEQQGLLPHWAIIAIGILIFLAGAYHGLRRPNAGANLGGRQGPSLLIFFFLLVLCFPLAFIYMLWPRRRMYGGRAYLSRSEQRQLNSIEAMELRAKLGRWNNDKA